VLKNIKFIILIILLFNYSGVACQEKLNTNDSQGLLVFKDIPYIRIEGFEQKFTSLDIYKPTAENDLPVLIFLHGGFWIQGDKGNYDYKAKAFIRENWIYISANYRLAPEAAFPANAEDVARAIAWVYENISAYGGNPNKLFLMGFSAGAHLAALVSTNEKYLFQHEMGLDIIKAVVLLETAYYDIPWRVMTEPYEKMIHSMAFGDDIIDWYKASPIHHIEPNKNIPPSLIIHTEKFERHHWQAVRLAEKLRQNGYIAQTYHASNFNHTELTTELGKPGDKIIENILDFLNQYL